MLRNQMTLRPGQLHPEPFEIEQFKLPFVFVNNELVRIILVRCGQSLGTDEDECVRSMTRLVSALAVAGELDFPICPNCVGKNYFVPGLIAANDGVPPFVTRSVKWIKIRVTNTCK
jgi:hypothetical protein